jgi:hypothetical protein
MNCEPSGTEAARSYHALEETYRQREIVFAAVIAGLAEQEAATRRQRQLAVAADAEPRRRHPGQYFAPLWSAEPGPAPGAQPAELTMTAGGRPRRWATDLAAVRRTFADRHSVQIPSEDPATAISPRRSPPGPASQGRDPAVS